MINKNKTIPKYSKYMYLEGHNPYTILQSARKSMFDAYIQDFNEDDEEEKEGDKEAVITINSEIKTK